MTMYRTGIFFLAALGSSCGSATDGGDAAVDSTMVDGSSLADASEGETCGNGLDDDVDGRVDEACTCDAMATQQCYLGDPTDPIGTGACAWGTQQCWPRGEWGPCSGYVALGAEECTDAVDNDCDGQVDGADANCAPDCSDVVIENDTCGEALQITTAGTYYGTVAGATDDIHHQDLEGACTPPDPAPDVLFYLALEGNWYVSVEPADGGADLFGLRAMAECSAEPAPGGGCGAGFSGAGPTWISVEPWGAATCFRLTVEAR